VEAALVIGIAVAYLKKAGRGDLIRWVYIGMAAALVSSLGLGYAFAKLKWNQDRFEGYVMLVAGALVASLVYMMWRAGKTMKAEIESSSPSALIPRSRAGTHAVCLFHDPARRRRDHRVLAAVTLNKRRLMEQRQASFSA